jgi:cephalosporin hydroxylase
METLNRTEALIDAAFTRGMIQVREEITALVDLLRTRSIKNVLEIGSESGGTFYLWCRLAAMGGLKISIDKPDGLSGSWSYVEPQALEERTALFKTWAPRVKVITGDSHDREIRYQVLRTLGMESFDLLFIDGDHSYAGVKKDWEDYKGLVRQGGLIIFHDIKDTECHRNRGCFVAKFWAELVGDKQELIGPGDWGGLGCLTV